MEKEKAIYRSRDQQRPREFQFPPFSRESDVSKNLRLTNILQYNRARSSSISREKGWRGVEGERVGVKRGEKWRSEWTAVGTRFAAGPTASRRSRLECPTELATRTTTTTCRYFPPLRSYHPVVPPPRYFNPTQRGGTFFDARSPNKTARKKKRIATQPLARDFLLSRCHGTGRRREEEGKVTGPCERGTRRNSGAFSNRRNFSIFDAIATPLLNNDRTTIAAREVSFAYRSRMSRKPRPRMKRASNM